MEDEKKVPAAPVRRRNRHRAWCFVLNNCGDERTRFSSNKMKYLVYQLEAGEEKETPHLQGYVCFKNPVSLKTCKDYLGGERYHVDVARGTAAQNKEYCTKSNTRQEGPWEFGEIPADPGRRSPLFTVDNLPAWFHNMVTEDHQNITFRYFNQ